MTQERTQDQNWKRLRERLVELKDALGSLDEVQYRDLALRAGFHPDRAGKILVGVLLERHRAQDHPPFIVEIGPADVVELADELGIESDLEEVAHA